MNELEQLGLMKLSQLAQDIDLAIRVITVLEKYPTLSKLYQAETNVSDELERRKPFRPEVTD